MVTQGGIGSDRIATISNKTETGGLAWISSVGRDRSLDPQRLAQPGRVGMPQIVVKPGSRNHPGDGSSPVQPVPCPETSYEGRS